MLLEHRIPTLVEKPMSADPDEGAALVQKASATNTLLAVGHVERFNSCVRLVKALLLDGSIGEPVAFSFRRVGLAPPSRPDLDVIHDLAVHDIDIFAHLTNSDARFLGASGWAGEQGLIESADVLLASPHGHGMVEVNWRTPVRLRTFTITTDRCLVQCNYTTQKVEIVEASTELDVQDFAEFRSHYGASKRTTLEPTISEPLAEEVQAFASVIRGEPCAHLATAKDGLDAVAIATSAATTVRQHLGDLDAR